MFLKEKMQQCNMIKHMNTRLLKLFRNTIVILNSEPNRKNEMLYRDNETITSLHVLRDTVKEISFFKIHAR